MKKTTSPKSRRRHKASTPQTRTSRSKSYSFTADKLVLGPTAVRRPQPLAARIWQFITKYWPVVLFCALGIGLRLWNYQHSLYFIYDQGRDAWILERLAHGKLILTGPTSGLPGFFLGPLWYYVGLPGYILSAGNPYLICVWYILIGCLALPLFWLFAKRLFVDRRWAALTAVTLAVVPGSIHAGIFIWNPLLSVPLMLGSFLCFLKARTSRWYLFLAFFLLALTLQSEFAYAIFFLPPLFLLIPWIRRRVDLKDFAAAILAVAVTGVPQLWFDLRHHFLMSHSLLIALSDKTQSIPWATHLATRPGQLLDVSMYLLLGGGNKPAWFIWTLLGLFGLGCLLSLIGSRRTSPLLISNPVQSTSQSLLDRQFAWKLLAIFAVIPYPFFLLWRGNHGYFFDYYLTCHFVFLVPLIIRGGQQVWQWSQRLWLSKVLLGIGLCLLVYIGARYSAKYWQDTVGAPDNKAGIFAMDQAVQTVYLQHGDPNTAPVVRIYTPNVYTEQYDYLFSWYARQHHLPAPKAQRDGTETKWFVFTENKAGDDPYFYQPWYYEATKSGQLIKETQVGALTIEQWGK